MASLAPTHLHGSPDLASVCGRYIKQGKRPLLHPSTILPSATKPLATLTRSPTLYPPVPAARSQPSPTTNSTRARMCHISVVHSCGCRSIARRDSRCDPLSPGKEHYQIVENLGYPCALCQVRARLAASNTSNQSTNNAIRRNREQASNSSNHSSMSTNIGHQQLGERLRALQVQLKRHLEDKESK